MKTETRMDYEGRIQQVLLYIRQHLNDDLSLKMLASVACFSEYHFHRIFCGIVGETLAEHIRRLRIERAAIKLKYSDKSVTELAFEAGYDNMESFTRAFRGRYGIAPSRYKTKLGNKKTKKLLDDFPKKIKGGKNMIDVKTKILSTRKVAFVRHIGPYNKCGEAWEKLFFWAKPKGIIGKDTRFLGLSYDDPDITPPDKLRYDACITINADVKSENGIDFQTIQEGEYAVVIHKGPYNKLNETYKKFFGEWLTKSGREIKDQPCIEVCLNDPKETPPEKLLVEIQFPLE